ncbi:MAG: hypothetical protein OXI19_12255 [Gemmatimonadota bacterium]|nr:hypothetical protein [Gemmatimonadota bacterium]
MSYTLDDEIRRISDEIKEDAYDLDVKRGVLAALLKMKSNVGSETPASPSESSSISLGPSDAVRLAFDRNVHMDLKLRDIVDSIQHCIDSGEIVVDSQVAVPVFTRNALYQMKLRKEVKLIQPDSSKKMYLYRYISKDGRPS